MVQTPRIESIPPKLTAHPPAASSVGLAKAQADAAVISLVLELILLVVVFLRRGILLVMARPMGLRAAG